MRCFSTFVFLIFLATSPVQAAGSKMNWEDFRSAVKSDCEAFSAAVMSSPINQSATPAKKRYPPSYPNNEPMLPYVCVGLKFDINGEGKTENIEVVFKSPADAGPGFERAAINSVKRWRYEPPANPDQQTVGLTTLITFEVAP